LPASVLYEPPGIARVGILWIGFDGILKSAFEQIRLYSKSDVAVSLRMLHALGDIAWTTLEPVFRRALYEEGRRIVEGCAEKLGEGELSPMRTRLSALENAQRPCPEDGTDMQSQQRLVIV
jgi:uncharacterized membrane protein